MDVRVNRRVEVDHQSALMLDTLPGECSSTVYPFTESLLAAQDDEMKQFVDRWLARSWRQAPGARRGQATKIEGPSWPDERVSEAKRIAAIQLTAQRPIDCSDHGTKFR